MLDWTCRGIGGWGWGVKNILEGSVDHIINRNYIVNRSSFISCSLATKPQRPSKGKFWRHTCSPSAVTKAVRTINILTSGKGCKDSRVLETKELGVLIVL